MKFKFIESIWFAVKNANKLRQIEEIVGHLQPVGKYHLIQQILRS